MPYQKVFEAQMQDRQNNGLCYFCDEKWHQGHKCLKLKLFLIESMELSDSMDGAIGLEQDKVAKDEIKQLEVCGRDSLNFASNYYGGSRS